MTELEISVRALEITLCIVVLIGFPATFALGFTIGKFKGAKDGIDYCFDQYEKKLGIKKGGNNESK